MLTSNHSFLDSVWKVSLFSEIYNDMIKCYVHCEPELSLQCIISLVLEYTK